MNILLTTLNAKYIHKNLALRWIYQACNDSTHVYLKEYTIKENIEHIISDVIAMDIDVLAFSTYIWNIEILKVLAIRLKALKPNLHIIAGGPEVSFESIHLLNQGIDALSIGEGEQSIWEYIEMLEKGESYEIIGICTNAFPNHIYRRVSLSFLEQLNDPYFMDIDKDNMDKQYLYFETSRGCPYHCAYCLSSVDTCVRMFSDDYIFKILEKISNSNVRQVKLLDRTFNANPSRALKIARYMNEHCQHQVFQFEVVAETLSDDLLRFFCEEADKTRFRLEIGVQSFHSPTLEAVGRIQNNERLKEVIFALRDANVMMHVDLIAGLPYEDYPTFAYSFDTLFAFEVKEIQLGILKLLKGTKLKKQKDQYDFFEESHAPYTILQTKWLTKEELILIDGAATACEKFYNSGKCRIIILEILYQGWFDSPFALFVELGKQYRELPHPYSMAALFRLFIHVLPDVNQHLLKAIITMEYYSHHNQRPVRLWKDMVSMEQRNELFKFMLEHTTENRNHLYHYGITDLGYLDHEIGYQIIIFQNDGSRPRYYFIDESMTYFKEVHHE